MKRRSFFRSLAVAPAAVAAFVREPDKMTEREFDEFLKLAMRYDTGRKKFFAQRGQAETMMGINQYIHANS